MGTRFTSEAPVGLSTRAENEWYNRWENGIEAVDNAAGAVVIPVDLTGAATREIWDLPAFTLGSIKEHRCVVDSVRVERPITFPGQDSVFDAAWNKGSGSSAVTVTDNTVADPRGAMTADRVTPDTANGATTLARIVNTITGYDLNNRAYLAEWWLRADTSHTAKLLITGATTATAVDVTVDSTWGIYRLERGKIAEAGTAQVRMQPDSASVTTVESVDVWRVRFYEVFENVQPGFVFQAGDRGKITRLAVGMKDTGYEQGATLAGTA